ncbi:GAF domain-containing protein [Aquibacillus rhizosphaerae]|uniref:GAF domain-containing protein n=1 Tax=Aquibacillus rhizosphaerae TaxID=3051431 RepID=A0ABT7L7S7_9BACI|nr:GAF domain-containing protein [Aquibacillus sp. LR5S19]MDL4841921.1 GAF domain-containing protein [Aquibacillus sp. LR5S19]
MEYSENDVKDLFLKECEHLKQVIGCDFTGVALQHHKKLDVIWPYVCGNRNDKYKYITVRYGKGIAGKVISSGSPMEIENFPTNIIGKSTEYPIMLAEKIITAYAYPLVWNGIPKGALLIGYRQKYDFKDEDYQKLKQTASRVQGLLPVYFVEN